MDNYFQLAIQNLKSIKHIQALRYPVRGGQGTKHFQGGRLKMEKQRLIKRAKFVTSHLTHALVCEVVISM